MAKFRTFWPLVKNRGGLVEMSVRIIRATPQFSAPVYFLPGGGDRRSGHMLDGWPKKREEKPAVKHIASGKVLPAAKLNCLHALGE